MTDHGKGGLMGLVNDYGVVLVLRALVAACIDLADEGGDGLNGGLMNAAVAIQKLAEELMVV